MRHRSRRRFVLPDVLDREGHGVAVGVGRAGDGERNPAVARPDGSGVVASGVGKPFQAGAIPIDGVDVGFSERPAGDGEAAAVVRPRCALDICRRVSELPQTRPIGPNREELTIGDERQQPAVE